MSWRNPWENVRNGTLGMAAVLFDGAVAAVIGTGAWAGVAELREHGLNNFLFDSFVDHAEASPLGHPGRDDVSMLTTLLVALGAGVIIHESARHGGHAAAHH